MAPSAHSIPCIRVEAQSLTHPAHSHAPTALRMASASAALIADPSEPVLLLRSAVRFRLRALAGVKARVGMAGAARVLRASGFEEKKSCKGKGEKRNRDGKREKSMSISTDESVKPPKKIIVGERE